MYGLWYITFGFLGLAIIGLVVGFVLKSKYNYYNKLYKAVRKAKEMEYAKENTDWDKYKELDKLVDQHYESKFKYQESDWIGWCTAIAAGFISFVLLLCSIFCPLTARREANYFMAQKEYVELAVENGKNLENIAITQTIIDQNKWLANAKASKATYGCFSKYHGVDLDSLEPIVINREVAK